MEHLDAELLSLLALGEHLGTDADAEHLAGCPECSESLRGLQHAVRIATLDLAGIELEEPGSQNWAAIHQALGLSQALATDPLYQRTAAPPVSSGKPAARPAAADAPPKDSKEPEAEPAPFRPGTKDRRARPGLWLAVAAAGIVLGTAAGWTAAGVLRDTGTPVPAATQSTPASIILAQTSLTPLPAHTGSGDAQVQELPDGTRQLTIRLSNENISGFRGVWVGSADLSKMVSLGVLANDSGVFTIPAGIDLAQYPIVDVSDQPYNGDPAHSADSIARGTLNLKT
ncbi:anti-sigma factor [Arthrobacter sp. PsM3]|uniref:anti-sigma factor n=1 Tax=Arthrobacter sp. PsM3 TaxID=3030531 RepID=UPI00263B720E|nr:anti-sigma factor [Arthrobacter sp. PsM3]MDN4646471.1 anti-sigma factor [Arthrobacter sp. PsM3]